MRAAPGVPVRRRPALLNLAFCAAQGFDAITGVSKLVEGFALKLDTVIGQAFEEWAPPSGSRTDHAAAAAAAAARREAPSEASPLHSTASPQQLAPQQPGSAEAATVGWGDFSVDSASPSGKENVSPQPAPAGKERARAQATARQAHITSFMSKLDVASEQEVQEWRRRAQQLAQELQRMRAQQEEYRRLQCALPRSARAPRTVPPVRVASDAHDLRYPACRDEYQKLEHDLERTNTTANKLAVENTQLKRRGPQPPMDPAAADPLAVQQVTSQMELLLTEKSKLAEENARLLRENTGLQVRALGGAQPAPLPLSAGSQRALPCWWHRSCWSSPWRTTLSLWATRSCLRARSWTRCRQGGAGLARQQPASAASASRWRLGTSAAECLAGCPGLGALGRVPPSLHEQFCNGRRCAARAGHAASHQALREGSGSAAVTSLQCWCAGELRGGLWRPPEVSRQHGCPGDRAPSSHPQRQHQGEPEAAWGSAASASRQAHRLLEGQGPAVAAGPPPRRAACSSLGL